MSPERLIVNLTGVGYAIVAFARAVIVAFKGKNTGYRMISRFSYW